MGIGRAIGRQMTDLFGDYLLKSRDVVEKTAMGGKKPVEVNKYLDEMRARNVSEEEIDDLGLNLESGKFTRDEMLEKIDELRNKNLTVNAEVGTNDKRIFESIEQESLNPFYESVNPDNPQDIQDMFESVGLVDGDLTDAAVEVGSKRAFELLPSSANMEAVKALPDNEKLPILGIRKEIDESLFHNYQPPYGNKDTYMEVVYGSNSKKYLDRRQNTERAESGTDIQQHFNMGDQLFHLRVNEGRNANDATEKVLNLFEIQSDLFQAYNIAEKSGNYNIRAGDLPFKRSWEALGMKEAIKLALKRDMDYLAIPPGIDIAESVGAAERLVTKFDNSFVFATDPVRGSQKMAVRKEGDQYNVELLGYDHDIQQIFEKKLRDLGIKFEYATVKLEDGIEEYLSVPELGPYLLGRIASSTPDMRLARDNIEMVNNILEQASGSEWSSGKIAYLEELLGPEIYGALDDAVGQVYRNIVNAAERTGSSTKMNRPMFSKTLVRASRGDAFGKEWLDKNITSVGTKLDDESRFSLFDFDAVYEVDADKVLTPGSKQGAIRFYDRKLVDKKMLKKLGVKLTKIKQQNTRTGKNVEMNALDLRPFKDPENAAKFQPYLYSILGYALTGGLGLTGLSASREAQAGERPDVGVPTGETSRVGRPVLKTSEGDLKSEWSKTIKMGDFYINVPSIWEGKEYSEDELRDKLLEGSIKPNSVHKTLEEAIEAAKSHSDSLLKSKQFNKGGMAEKEDEQVARFKRQAEEAMAKLQAMAQGDVPQNVEDMDEELDKLFHDYYNMNHKDVSKAKETRLAYSQLVRQMQKDNPEVFQHFLDKNTEQKIEALNELDFGDRILPYDEQVAEKAKYTLNLPFGSEDDDTLGGNTDLHGFAGFGDKHTDETNQMEEIMAAGGANKNKRDHTIRHEATHKLVDSRDIEMSEERVLRDLDVLRAYVKQDQDLLDQIGEIHKKNYGGVDGNKTSSTIKAIYRAMNAIPELYQNGAFEADETSQAAAELIMDEMDKDAQGFMDSLLGEEPEKQDAYRVAVGLLFDRNDIKRMLDVAPYSEAQTEGRTSPIYEAKRDKMKFAEGGSVERDPVSGNEVPVGALPEEVRDDVPAFLSEGEFVIPADVVRYIGLDKLRKMRDQAKKGLQQMDEEGQIGGEPVDTPLEMATGGFVQDGQQLTGEQRFTKAPKFSVDSTPVGQQVQAQSRGRQGRPVQAASSGYEMRKYVSEDGRILYIPFIGGEAMMDIPEGYTEASRMEDIKKQAGVLTEDDPKVESATVGTASARAETGSSDSDGMPQAVDPDKQTATTDSMLTELAKAINDEEFNAAVGEYKKEKSMEDLGNIIKAIVIPGGGAMAIGKAIKGAFEDPIRAGDVKDERLGEARSNLTGATKKMYDKIVQTFGKADTSTGEYIADSLLIGGTKMTNGNVKNLMSQMTKGLDEAFASGRITADQLKAMNMDVGTLYAQALAGVAQSPAGQMRGGMDKINNAIDKWGGTYLKNWDGSMAQYDPTKDNLGFFDSITAFFGGTNERIAERDSMLEQMQSASEATRARAQEEVRRQEAEEAEKARIAELEKQALLAKQADEAAKAAEKAEVARKAAEARAAKTNYTADVGGGYSSSSSGGYTSSTTGGYTFSYGSASPSGQNTASSISGGTGRTDGGWGWAKGGLVTRPTAAKKEKKTKKGLVDKR